MSTSRGVVRRIGILHPGAMGTLIGEAARNQGNIVFWASAGRSATTSANARRCGAIDVKEVCQLSAACDIIFSVGPPGSAEAIASQVYQGDFAGIYVDCSATSFDEFRRVAEVFKETPVSVVDASIVKAPRIAPASVQIFVTGDGSEEIANSLHQGILPVFVLGESAGTCKSLKLCLDSYEKTGAILRLLALAAAEALGIKSLLIYEWSRENPQLEEELPNQLRKLAIKSPRFAAELDDIAKAFASLGLPADLPKSASRAFSRLADLGYEARTISITQILSTLREGS